MRAGSKPACRTLLKSDARLRRDASSGYRSVLQSAQEAVEQIERSGTKVFACAPSVGASRDVVRNAGFEDADTVARLLVDENIQRRAAGQVPWIDEAGLLGSGRWKGYSTWPRVSARGCYSPAIGGGTVGSNAARRCGCW